MATQITLEKAIERIFAFRTMQYPRPTFLRLDSPQSLDIIFQGLALKKIGIVTTNPVDQEGDSLKEYKLEEFKNAKVIIAKSNSDKGIPEFYNLCRKFAEDLNVNLVFLECGSAYGDSEFSSAEVVYCYNQRALNAGEIIAQIEATEKPDNIVMFKDRLGNLKLVTNYFNGMPYQSEHFNCATLAEGFDTTHTAKEFVDFLKASVVDDTKIGTLVDIASYITAVEAFDGNVTFLNTEGQHNGYYTYLIQRLLNDVKYNKYYCPLKRK